MLHRFSSGLVVEVAGADEADPPDDARQYGIYLHDGFGHDVVSWTGDEWIEDPTVVASIVNAICLGERSFHSLKESVRPPTP